VTFYTYLEIFLAFYLDQLQFNQLIIAIPKTRKIKLQNGKKNKLMVCLSQIRCLKWLSGVKINKIIYIWNLNITGTALFLHRTCWFWEDEFNDAILWKDYIRKMYRTTVDSYLFQNIST